jgi:hypothetical protein
MLYTYSVLSLSRTYESKRFWLLWWELGQRRMSQVLGALELLNFTMLWPVLAWHSFWNLWTVCFFTYPVFLGLRQTADDWNRVYWIGGYGGTTVQFSCSLCGYERWSFTLKNGNWWFFIIMSWGYLDMKLERNKWQECGERYADVMRGIAICFTKYC